MRILSRFSYKKLKQEVVFEDEELDGCHNNRERRLQVIKRSTPRKSWFRRLRKGRQRFKFSGFRRFFKIRRIRVARLSWAKIMKRLKESQAHFGDLFAGNYMFMQVTPASFNNKPYLAYHDQNQKYKLPEIPSRYNNYALEKVT